MNSEKFSVIVVGGGMAGVSCCSKLIENGIHDVLLLEANDRLGGRINTINFGSDYIELGAQWIHGKKNNPIYALAKSLSNIDEKQIPDSAIYADQTGKQYDEDYIDRINEKIEKIFDNLEDLIEDELEDDSNRSLGSLLNDGFGKLLKKFNPNEYNVELIKALFHARLNEERSDNACDDLKYLSAVGWNEYEDFDEEQLNRLKYGYHKLIEHLVAFLNKSSIRLNERVEHIDWSSSSDGLVTLKSFNTLEKKYKIYKADCVVVTIPLGVLKKTHSNLFSPSLPQNKVKAIERLGFGTVNKIFTVFEKPIGDKELSSLQILWLNDQKYVELDACKNKWNVHNPHFVKSLDNFDVLPNQRNILLTFVAGEDAFFSETIEEECLLDIIHELLTRSFPKLNIPRPKQIVRSKWNSNQLSMGSYSYSSTASSIKDFKNLFQPINDKLFFAGEATNFKFYSTVHGAYITGRDVANKIKNVLE